MISLTLVFTTSVGTLQPTRPLGPVEVKFIWKSEDQYQTTHANWFLFCHIYKTKTAIMFHGCNVWCTRSCLRDGEFLIGREYDLIRPENHIWRNWTSQTLEVIQNCVVDCKNTIFTHYVSQFCYQLNWVLLAEPPWRNKWYSMWFPVGRVR